MQQQCKEFINLIKNERFYDAHEVLEEIWYPKRKEKDPYTLVLKGFINASVAFELQRLGRKANAKKVWQTYEKYRKFIAECDESLFFEIEHFLDECYDKYLS